MSNRIAPPSRRPAEIVSMKYPPNSWGAPTYIVSFGRDAAEHINEVFVSSSRPSGSLADVIRDASIIISIALQSGTSIEGLRGKITRLSDGAAASIIGGVIDLIAPPGDGPTPPADPFISPAKPARAPAA